MANNDDALGSVLWLVAGGAAGYATGRWLVGRRLPRRAVSDAHTALIGTSNSGTLATTLPALTTTVPQRSRALGAGPVHSYGGPSGEMRPVDPYAEVPSSATTASSPASSIGNGPITRPSQIDSRSATQPSEQAAPVTRSPSAAFATSPRVRRFDPVFDRYRGDLPLEYVRALVERESDGQPSARTGRAIGLMQIVPVVLADYNKRHGTAYQSEHLVDPATNVAIGCELLQRIVVSYRKNHPRITNLQADWGNLRFVELLTFGWNAGYSEAAGVGRVARYLEGLGAFDITIDQVSAHAQVAGASRHLSNSAKVGWCKSVVALYQRERALGRTFPSS
ncbi:MAG: transglycosylase SLT domain-containing protein [Kofleriaceae bacterium]